MTDWRNRGGPMAHCTAIDEAPIGRLLDTLLRREHDPLAWHPFRGYDFGAADRDVVAGVLGIIAAELRHAIQEGRMIAVQRRLRELDAA